MPQHWLAALKDDDTAATLIKPVQGSFRLPVGSELHTMKGTADSADCSGGQLIAGKKGVFREKVSHQNVKILPGKCWRQCTSLLKTFTYRWKII